MGGRPDRSGEHGEQDATYVAQLGRLLKGSYTGASRGPGLQSRPLILLYRPAPYREPFSARRRSYCDACLQQLVRSSLALGNEGALTLSSQINTLPAVQGGVRGGDCGRGGAGECGRLEARVGNGIGTVLG